MTRRTAVTHPAAVPAAVRTAGRRVRLAGGHRATAAVLAQGITAGSSLLLQVLAARSLGPSGYGTYSLLLAALVLLTGVQTGWIGDSLTVLGWRDAGTRGALMVSQAGFLVGAGLVAAAIVVFLPSGSASPLLYAATVALWLCEDTGRRLLMAEMRFWHLVVNDLCYLVGTLLALLALSGRGGLQLDHFLLAMAIGAAGAVLVAALQVPRGSLRGAVWSGQRFREVAGFAVWRSGGAGTRPLAILLTRTAVAVGASAAALGQLEAARLLMAPVLVFVNGVSSFLLPFYSGRGGERRSGLRSVARVTVGVVAAVGLYSIIALVWMDQITRLLVGPEFELERVAVLGWSVFAAAYAAGLPVTTAILARRESRRVFLSRVLDSAVGVIAVVVLLQVAPTAFVPFGLSFGILVATALLWRHLKNVSPA